MGPKIEPNLAPSAAPVFAPTIPPPAIVADSAKLLPSSRFRPRLIAPLNHGIPLPPALLPLGVDAAAAPEPVDDGGRGGAPPPRPPARDAPKALAPLAAN